MRFLICLLCLSSINSIPVHGDPSDTHSTLQPFSDNRQTLLDFEGYIMGQYYSDEQAELLAQTLIPRILANSSLPNMEIAENFVNAVDSDIGQKLQTDPQKQRNLNILLRELNNLVTTQTRNSQNRSYETKIVYAAGFLTIISMFLAFKYFYLYPQVITQNLSTI